MGDAYLKRFEGMYFQKDGINYHYMLTNEASIRNLYDYDDVREDDVIVWTYPKSGTHAVLDIVWKVMLGGDLEKYATQSGELWYEIFKVPGLPPPHNPAAVFPGSLEELSAVPSPRVISTHARYQQMPKKLQTGKNKIIYVSRDPKDAFVSAYKMSEALTKMFNKESVPWTVLFDAFIHGKVFFGSWADHIRNFYGVKDKPNILWIKYDELIKDPRSHIQLISDFLEQRIDADGIARIADSCKFESVLKQFPNSLFLNKGRSGGWKEHFTVAESELFDQKMREALGDIANVILN